MSAKRDAGLELLRVLSMLAVVVAHFLCWGTTTRIGGPVVAFANGGVNSFLYPFASSFSSMGVICFVLITSYFICDRRELRFDRALKVWLVTFFYSVALAVIISFIKPLPFKNIVLSFFPIYSCQYWFVTKYVALILIAPMLSIIVNTVSKKGILIILGVLVFMIVTITYGVPYGNTFFAESPRSVAAFVMIFFIAAYLKKYGASPWLVKNSGLIVLISLLAQGVGGIGLNLIHDSDSVIYGGFSIGNNAFSLVPATALFLWFKNHSFKESWFVRFIVKLAPFTFAVYLIHDNNYFRSILWNDIINPAIYWDSPLWGALLIIVPIVILVASCAIDTVRTLIFRLCRTDKLVEWVKKYNVIIN